MTKISVFILLSALIGAVFWSMAVVLMIPGYLIFLIAERLDDNRFVS